MITQEQFQLIEAMLKFRERETLSAFLLEHGIWQKGAPLSGNFERGPLSHCFENSWKAAKKHGLNYWEGYCWSPREFGELPFHHAWCVEPKSGDVVDVTWPFQVEYLYRGVHIPTNKFDEFKGKSKSFSALDREIGLQAGLIKSVFGWTPSSNRRLSTSSCNFGEYLELQETFASD